MGRENGEGRTRAVARRGWNPCRVAAAVAGVLVPAGVAGAAPFYTQNFDTMGPAGTAPPAGWVSGAYATLQNNVATPGGAITAGALTADDGSDATKGRSYNYGTVGAADRALGSLPTTSTGDRGIQGAVVNNTGAPITSFTLQYTGEEWRAWDVQAGEKLALFYSTAPGAGFVSMGTAFDFVAPQTSAGTGAAIDGNAAANRLVISGTYTPAAPIADGQTFYLTWHDVNDPVNDHGLAVDDVSVTAVVPEPAALSLLAVAAGATLLRRGRAARRG